MSSLRELHGHWKKVALFTFLASCGSVAGSWLLLIAPASSFEKIVPFFIFAAGLLLLLSSRKKGISKNSLPTQANIWISLVSLIGIFFCWRLHRLFWCCWWRYLFSNSLFNY